MGGAEFRFGGPSRLIAFVGQSVIERQASFGVVPLQNSVAGLPGVRFFGVSWVIRHGGDDELPYLCEGVVSYPSRWRDAQGENSARNLSCEFGRNESSHSLGGNGP